MRLSTPFVVLGLVFCLVVDLAAQSVRVVFVSGQASVQRPEEPALRPAVKGETVIIGTRIVTGADGRLVLTPMPGIKSIVTPNTTLLLESATENRTSDTNVTQKVVLDLKEGSVVSDLQKPEGVTYDYSIRTARGLAGARGTTYTVGINSAGIQTIVVAHGAISINFSDGSKMTLAPGQLSVTKANGQSQKVENISQLSPEDQKVAQKGAETTIAAIATAIDAGISVAPEALNNALAAAKDLGVTISPETQKSCLLYTS
ncbi:MAG: FecR domain-containing protein, partial [Opitutus sp.]|nr:FecR domain-containing protein [Opitutus sp.]